MKKHILIIFFAILFLASCSEEELNPSNTSGLTKIYDGYALGAGIKLQVWADNDFVTGYNPVYYTLSDSVSGKAVTDSHIHLHATMTMSGGMSHGCPVENPLEEKAVNGLFTGGVMFTMPSGDAGSWRLEVKVHNHHTNRFGKAEFPVAVSNPASTAFQLIQDGDTRYFLSYHKKGGVSVGMNELTWIIYTRNANHEFVPVEDLSFIVEPTMPGMDHGSPNNVNPVHRGNGHYTGKVNFTMTGLWRMDVSISRSGVAVADTKFDVTVK